MNEALNDKYGRAILRAQRAGDKEAAEALTQDLARQQAGEGTFTEKVGAGMMDVVQNIGNVMGRTSDSELAEQNKYAGMADPAGWGRMAGQAIAMAPAALIPGANTVAGSAVIGSGIGAVMAPEDRLKGAAIGGLTGGAAQGVMSRLPKALSAAGRGIKNQIATRTPFLPGTKQEIAERAFTGGLDNPNAALDQLTNYAGPSRELPGFRQTTAAVTGDAGALATERALREGAFGELGAPVRAVTAQQNRAVRGAMDTALGDKAAPAADEAARFGAQAFENDVPAAFASSAFGSTPKVFTRTFKAFDDALDNAVGSEKDKLLALRAKLEEAIMVAHRTGDSRPLAAFRRQSIKDELTKMHTAGESATAQLVRHKLTPIKDVFDGEMDRFTSGEWTPAMQGYARRAADRGQAEAGEALLESKLYTAKPDSTGELRTDKLQTALEREFGSGMTPTDRFGGPKYSPRAEPVLRRAMEEMQRAKSPYAPDIAARGSATAQNLTAGGKVLRQAMGAAQEAGRVSPIEGMLGAGGAATGNVPMVVAALGKHYALDPMKAKATADIAERLVQMYVDPNKAVDALIRSMPHPDQRAQRQFAIQLIEQRLLPSLAQGAAASAAMSMPALESAQ